MNNKLFKAATFCLSVVVLVAWNKDKPSELKPATGTSNQIDDPIEQLRTFRKQIESVKAHPEAKSTETITLAEALWDIENNFNLTYSDAEQYYGQINDHEFTLPLPITQDHDVLVYDAVSLYTDVIAQARDAFASDPFEEKGFISLTVKDLEDNGDLINVTFSGKTGERSNYNPPIAHVIGPFGGDDNWMFSAPMGKCDDPDIPSGADEQLQEKLYAELIEPFTETDLGYRNIYIDRKRFAFDGTNYSNIYYNTDSQNMCIEYLFMNDYYYAEKTIISRTIPEQYHLTGYCPISIEIEGRILQDPFATTHYNEIEYGIRMRVCTNEFGETKDLMSE